MNTSNIQFRKANSQDAKRIWEIINQAKAQMKRLGSCQWNEEYPSFESIEQDIQNSEGYVFETEGNVIAYGVVSFQEEPVYRQIETQWRSSLPYLVVHRLAVADEAKRQGIAKRFMQEAEKVACKNGVYSFRIDTKHDNHYMLRIIEELGFEYRGDVVYRGNEVRMAFEKTIQHEPNY